MQPYKNNKIKQLYMRQLHSKSILIYHLLKVLSFRALKSIDNKITTKFRETFLNNIISCEQSCETIQTFGGLVNHLYKL